MLRGTPMSTTSSARPSRAVITVSTSRCARRAGRQLRWTRAARRTRRARRGSSSRAIARPPTRLASSSGAGRRAVGDDDLADAGARERERHALAHVARAEHEHATVVEGCRAGWWPSDDRGRRHRHRVPADRGLGAGPLAHLDRVAEGARRAAGRSPTSRSATLPRLAHLAEDLALADDHRVEPGGDPEEVRDRGVVVVGVEQVGELVGVDARGVGEEVAHVLHRRVEQRGVRVDLGAVARGEQDRPRRGARARASGCSAFGSASGATAMRSRSADRHRAVVEADYDERHARSDLLGFVHAPGADQVEHAGIERRLPIRFLGGTPGGPQLFPGFREHVEQCGVLGPELGLEASPEPGGERRAAPAGADGDHEVALAHDRHQGERAVRGVVGRVHPDAGGPRRPRTPRGRRPGSPVAVVASQAPSRSGGVEPPLGDREATGVGQARTSSPIAGATTCTSAPAASSASILRAAMRPAPTTTQRRPATTRFTG